MESSQAAGPVPDFTELLQRHSWRPIRACPGRFQLVGPQPTLTDLLGAEARVRTQRVPNAPDQVAVCALSGGGTISYLRADGSWLHTLNTPEGFARKLAQLGIEAEPNEIQV